MEKRKTEKTKTKAARAAAEAPKVEKASQVSEVKSATASTETAMQEYSVAAKEASARATEFRAAIETAEAEKDAAAMRVRKEAEKAARNTDPFETLAKRYAEAYPDCRTFHITTDRQVFLEKDKNLAQFHQKGLGGGEIRTIKVK